MSRFYEMQVEITGFNPDTKEKIIEACCREWPFEPEDLAYDPGNNGKMWALAQDNLCGGESEDEFVERLRHAVWAANGAYCQVEIQATYLEDQPREIYSSDENDYKEWLKKEI